MAKQETIRKTIMLTNVRLSFPSLFKTETYKGKDTGKYSASFLIPKKSPLGKQVSKEIQDLAKQRFGDPIPKSVEYPIQDGDKKEWDGYAGMWSIKGLTKDRILMIDKRKRPVVEDDGTFYAGCYVNVKLELYAYSGEWGDRVGCSILAMQFAGDGEAFGAGPADPMALMDDFDVIEGEEPEADVVDDEDDEDSPFA